MSVKEIYRGRSSFVLHCKFTSSLWNKQTDFVNERINQIYIVLNIIKIH